MDSVVGIAADLVKVDGGDEFVTGLDDIQAAQSIFVVDTISGTLQLGPGRWRSTTAAPPTAT